MKVNNKGFSLVEILVSLAIGSVVLLGVTAFMNGSSQSYRTASTQVALQDDIQETLNYLSDVAQRQMSVVPVFTSNVWYIFAPKTDSEAGGFEVIYLLYDQSNQKLYVDTKDVTDDNYDGGLRLDYSDIKSRYKQENLLASDLVEFTYNGSMESKTKPDGTVVNYLGMTHINCKFRKNGKMRTETISVRSRNREWYYKNPKSSRSFYEVIEHP